MSSRSNRRIIGDPFASGSTYPSVQELNQTTICNSPIEQYRVGPIKSTALEPHGRPIICMDIQGTTLVTGSMDHGLRVYDIESCIFKRELFAKRYGHSEWVTTVSIGPDQRVLSGGMDSKLCYWKKNSSVCDYWDGHTLSISKVSIHPEGKFALTASYDKTMVLWDMEQWRNANSRERLIGHKAAVVSFDWTTTSFVISGDRSGVVKLWDLERCRIMRSMSKVHTGSVTQCHRSGQSLLLTGCTNGVFNVFDKRKQKSIFRFDHGKGVSINDICTSARGEIIIGTSDKIVKWWDVRKFSEGTLPIDLTGHQDVVSCVTTGGDPGNTVVFSASYKGQILVHDINKKEPLYGFGASKSGGINCIALAGGGNGIPHSKLVSVGDDAVPLVFDFIM